MSALLTVEQVTKRYAVDTIALRDVSLTVAAGEIVCLLGPSGCGKTTLLRVIAGLEQPESGRVLFDGRALDGVPAHKRGFGMMFQQFALFPHLTVAQNVGYGLRVGGATEPAIAQRVAEMLALVALDGAGARPIDQLSGGEQQRVALARALAVRPSLLLLDEPLGALDRQLRERLMLDLRAILKQVDVTAIYVTHDQSEAFAVADRIAVMRQGQIEQIAAPQALYDRPATPFVARFLGFENIIEGRVRTSGVVETALGTLRVTAAREPGTTVTLLIRPDAYQSPATAANPLSGTLDSLLFRGRYWLARLTINGVPLALELERPPADWQTGASVVLSLDPNAIDVLPTSTG